MSRSLGILNLLLSLLLVADVYADVAGSSDHPLITRYPGSKITWYDQQEFEKYNIATGPVTGYGKIDQWQPVAGKLIRINYSLAGTHSFYEVYANYLAALKKAGFQVLTEGSDKSLSVQGKIGQRGFLNVHYAANPIPPGASKLLDGSATSGGGGYLAARLDRPQGTVYVVLSTTQYQQDAVVTLLDIIETKPVVDDLITVDAAAMSKDIGEFGKVALYGIFFDHNQSQMKPESRPALLEIVKLLNDRKALKLYVVGHTDAIGETAYNMRLSEARAKAIVDALVRDHGIAAARLEPHGVGPLVPVATNQAEQGKAKNRRVELVER